MSMPDTARIEQELPPLRRTLSRLSAAFLPDRRSSAVTGVQASVTNYRQVARTRLCPPASCNTVCSRSKTTAAVVCSFNNEQVAFTHCREWTVSEHRKTEFSTRPTVEAIAHSIARRQRPAHHAVFRYSGLLSRERAQVDSSMVPQPSAWLLKKHFHNSALPTPPQTLFEQLSEHHSAQSSTALVQPFYRIVSIGPPGQVQQCSGSETESSPVPEYILWQQHSASDASLAAQSQATRVAKAVKAVTKAVGTVPIDIIGTVTLMNRFGLLPQKLVAIAEHVCREDDLAPYELSLSQDLKSAITQELMARAQHYAEKLFARQFQLLLDLTLAFREELMACAKHYALKMYTMLPRQCHKAESNVQDSKPFVLCVLNPNKLVQSSPVRVQMYVNGSLWLGTEAPVMAPHGVDFSFHFLLDSNTVGKCPRPTCRINITVS